MAVDAAIRNAQSRAYYHRMSPEARAVRLAGLRDHQRKAVALRRSFADAAKAGGCVDCGEKDLVVLDLDHVRGKKVAGIGALVVGRAPLEVLFAEIEKCETRCANCHRRVTAQRRSA